MTAYEKWIARALIAGVMVMGAAGAAAQDVPPNEDEIVCAPPLAGTGSAFAYYRGQGDALFATARLTPALIAYTCALRERADDAEVYARRGYVYTQLGDSERAIADYDQALVLNELNVPAYINRGALYTRLGNFGLAINDLTLAIGLEPDNVTALTNRAVVHAIEGTTDAALADANAALAIDPESAAALAIRAAVYQSLAARDYQRIVQITGSNMLPAGTPSDLMFDLDASLRTGDFSVWLALLNAEVTP